MSIEILDSDQVLREIVGALKLAPADVSRRPSRQGDDDARLDQAAVQWLNARGLSYQAARYAGAVKAKMPNAQGFFDAAALLLDMVDNPGLFGELRAPVVQRLRAVMGSRYGSANRTIR